MFNPSLLRSRAAVLAFVVLCVVLGAAVLPARVQANGIVRLYYFFDPDCDVCKDMQTNVLPLLVEKWGDRLEIVKLDMNVPQNFQFLLALEQQAGIIEASLPEVFIGTDVLIGGDEIRGRLPERVEYYMEQGGVALPTIAPRSTPTAVPTQAAPIHAAWFYNSGCDICERKQHDLNYITNKYPQIKLQLFDAKVDVALQQYLSTRAGAPEGKQLGAPAFYVGDAYLMGNEINAQALEALVVRYLVTGAPAPWEGFDAEKAEAEQTLVQRFRSMGIWTVVGAGLLDGINPCAFATMIFLISYLSVRKRQGRELLLTGLAFTSGVFVAYLGVGLGMLRFLTSLPFLNAIGKWVYGITAIMCLGLAWGSIQDYRKARQGRLEDMALKLPDRLRSLIHRLIREGSSARNYVLSSLALGFAVSIVELACTGQVYLPTIIFVLGLPEWRLRAGLALVGYNLMFITPLVIVFLLAYFGATSKRLTRWLNDNCAWVKLATAALFVLLAAWLGYSIVA